MTTSSETKSLVHGQNDLAIYHQELPILMYKLVHLINTVTIHRSLDKNYVKFILSLCYF